MAPAHAGGGTQYHFFTELAHVGKQFFGFTLLGNGPTQQRCLLVGYRHGHCLALSLACPAPSCGRHLDQAALTQPVQFCQRAAPPLKAPPSLLALRLRQKLWFSHFVLGIPV